MNPPTIPAPRPPGVLLVDDEVFIRDVISLALRRQGYTVLTAANGREAIELYQRQRDAIDVVLLDLMMPGLDGHATRAELLRINPAVRCCIMSGTATGEGDFAGVRSVGKPFALADLSRVLGEMLAPCSPAPSGEPVSAGAGGQPVEKEKPS